MKKQTKVLLGVLTLVVVAVVTAMFVSGGNLKGLLVEKQVGPRGAVSAIPDGKVLVRLNSGSPTGNQTASHDNTLAIYDFCAGEESVQFGTIQVETYSDNGQMKVSSYPTPDIYTNIQSMGVKTHVNDTTLSRFYNYFELGFTNILTSSVNAHTCVQVYIQADVLGIMNLTSVRDPLKVGIIKVMDYDGRSILYGDPLKSTIYY